MGHASSRIEDHGLELQSGEKDKITFFECAPPLTTVLTISDIPSGCIDGMFILTAYLTLSDILSGIFFHIINDILSDIY